MHDAVAMGLLQCLGNLNPVLQRLLERQRTFFQPIGERLAVEQFHDQIVGSILFADVVEMADVRVAQSRNRFGFALKARFQIRIGRKMRGQDFDGDIPAEPGVARAVDFAHASGAQRGLNLVRPEFRASRERHGCARLYANDLFSNDPISTIRFQRSREVPRAWQLLFEPAEDDDIVVVVASAGDCEFLSVR